MIPRRVVRLIIGLSALIFIGVSLIAPFGAQAKTRVEVNIFYPDGVHDVSKLNALRQDLGVDFSAAKWYMDWATDFDAGVANQFQTNGYRPELTWEPQQSGAGIAYDQVIAGSYDNYLIHNAQLVRSLGYPIRISLAPEMNATWTPWGGRSGNTSDNFRAFWQHVVQIFRAQGVTNVQWVWSPNVQPYGAEKVGSYAQMYPGDAAVDYLGLDGYNWGTSQSWSEWQTFSQVFENSYNELIGVSGKDILIMEVASAELGGSKAAWIADMFNQLSSRFSHIKGLTWFNINKETDWRITSSPAAQQSFTNGYLNAAQSSSGTSSSTGTSSTPAGHSGATKTKSSLATTATTSTPTDSQVIAPPTPASASLATDDTSYKITSPILPKIAGVQSDRVTQSLQQFSLIMSMLLSLAILAYLLNRRYRLIHGPIAVSLNEANFFGLGYVDSVFRPDLAIHHRRWRS